MNVCGGYVKWKKSENKKQLQAFEWASQDQ